MGMGAYWDKVINAMIGCDPVTSGCDYCFAPPAAWIRKSNPNEQVADAFRGVARKYTGDRAGWTGRVNMLPDRLAEPLRTRKPTRYYITLLGDTFHDGVTDDYIAQIFAMCAVTRRHTYLNTTKRHARMRSLLNDPHFREKVGEHAVRLAGERGAQPWDGAWPLPNVHLAVSVENQKTADMRIPALLATPAAVRWISAEPLLGPISLRGWIERIPVEEGGYPAYLDWVVTGGESGSPRAVHPDWVRSLRDECVAAKVPFFFKQYGDWTAERQIGGARPGRFQYIGPNGERFDERNPPDMDPSWAAMYRVGTKTAGRELDGRTWDMLPGDTYPQVVTP